MQLHLPSSFPHPTYTVEHKYLDYLLSFGIALGGEREHSNAFLKE